MNKLFLLLIGLCAVLLIFYANTTDLFKSGISCRQSNGNSSSSSIIDGNEPACNVVMINSSVNFLSSSKLQQNLGTNNHNNNNEWQYNNNQVAADDHRRIHNRTAEFNIFVIYAKQNYILKMKFELFVKSLLKYTSINVHMHIISDKRSKQFAQNTLNRMIDQYKRSIFFTMYDIDNCTRNNSDISHLMMPYFSSNPGSYYSKELLYLSLGLHRIVDKSMQRAILIDCDVVFRTDVKRLFDEFDRFSPDNLFGLAPELTPVYRHVLCDYRAKNPETNFGNPYYRLHHQQTMYIPSKRKKHQQQQQQQQHNYDENGIKAMSIRHGYPGLNSGVVLLNFDRIRKSKLYSEILLPENVKRLVGKYLFKGHLADQDFYTLIGFEYPELIYRMDCVWNRQLCTWWKDHGYSDVFDEFFHCEGKIHIYHGNCNTRAPE